MKALKAIRLRGGKSCAFIRFGDSGSAGLEEPRDMEYGIWDYWVGYEKVSNVKTCAGSSLFLLLILFLKGANNPVYNFLLIFR